MDNKFKFKKKFGQNFLKDDKIITTLLAKIDILTNNLVIEVGPGSGILTSKLIKKFDNVISYEIDTSLKKILQSKFQNSNNLEVIYGDFLKMNIITDIQKYSYKHLYFVSNVPYYITTPILFKLIDSEIEFTNIVMMVQKEVGERFNAKVGSKSYNALTVILNYYFKINKIVDVPRENFIPVPNVDSVVISLETKSNKEKLKDEQKFLQLVNESFKFKRKTLRNNLKQYDLKKIASVLQKYNLNLNVRAEQIDYKIFIDISNSCF